MRSCAGMGVPSPPWLEGFTQRSGLRFLALSDVGAVGRRGVVLDVALHAPSVRGWVELTHHPKRHVDARRHPLARHDLSVADETRLADDVHAERGQPVL